MWERKKRDKCKIARQRHIGHRETEMERKRQRGKERETEETERVRLTSYCVYEAVVTQYNDL